MNRRKTGGRMAPGAFDQSQKSAAKPEADTMDQPQAEFARSMTKSVFGRFYWDDVLEQEKQRAMIKKKKKRK